MSFARSRGAPLQEQIGRYRFTHLALQQSLAACHLCATHDPAGMAAFLAEADRLATDWWREVAFLMAGYFVAPTNADRDDARLRDFLRALADQGQNLDRSPGARFACAEVAALAASDFLPAGDPARAAVAERVAAMMEDRATMDVTPPRARAGLGDVLAHLGDSRRHVLDVDAMRFCVVPPGPFCMGSDDADPEALDSEKGNPPQVEVPYAYAIGQHPVTNAQYAAFVRDPSYKDPRWWQVAIQAGVWRDGRFTRRVAVQKFGEAVHTPEAWWALVEQGAFEEGFQEADRPWNFDAFAEEAPNRPVIGLTWYEALAFCAWLEARWQAAGWLRAGQRVRLPNEPEWEKAARGGLMIPASPVVAGVPELCALRALPLVPNDRPTRRYPWGDDFDAMWANTFEAGIGRPCAVGCFPGGASPYGCHDLAGNVYEWTRSLYGPATGGFPHRIALQFPYPYDAMDGAREAEAAGTSITRVLRGGSYFWYLRYARCARRGWDRPDLGNGDGGLRVVLSPLSLLTSGL